MFQEHDPRSGMSAAEIIPVILMDHFSARDICSLQKTITPVLHKQIFLLENQTHLCGTIRTNR